MELPEDQESQVEQDYNFHLEPTSSPASLLDLVIHENEAPHEQDSFVATSFVGETQYESMEHDTQASEDPQVVPVAAAIVKPSNTLSTNSPGPSRPRESFSAITRTDLPGPTSPEKFRYGAAPNREISYKRQLPQHQVDNGSVKAKVISRSLPTPISASEQDGQVNKHGEETLPAVSVMADHSRTDSPAPPPIHRVARTAAAHGHRLPELQTIEAIDDNRGTNQTENGSDTSPHQAAEVHASGILPKSNTRTSRTTNIQETSSHASFPNAMLNIVSVKNLSRGSIKAFQKPIKPALSIPQLMPQPQLDKNHQKYLFSSKLNTLPFPVVASPKERSDCLSKPPNQETPMNTTFARITAANEINNPVSGVFHGPSVFQTSIRQSEQDNSRDGLSSNHSSTIMRANPSPDHASAKHHTLVETTQHLEDTEGMGVELPEVDNTSLLQLDGSCGRIIQAEDNSIVSGEVPTQQIRSRSARNHHDSEPLSKTPSRALSNRSVSRASSRNENRAQSTRPMISCQTEKEPNQTLSGPRTNATRVQKTKTGKTTNRGASSQQYSQYDGYEGKLQELNEHHIEQQKKLQHLQHINKTLETDLTKLESENGQLKKNVKQYMAVHERYKENAKQIVTDQEFLMAGATRIQALPAVFSSKIATEIERIKQELDTKVQHCSVAAEKLQTAYDEIKTFANSAVEENEKLTQEIMDVERLNFELRRDARESSERFEDMEKDYAKKLTDLRSNNRVLDDTIQKHLFEMSAQMNQINILNAEIEHRPQFPQYITDMLKQLPSTVTEELIKDDGIIARILTSASTTQTKLDEVANQMSTFTSNGVEPSPAMTKLVEDLFTRLEGLLPADSGAAPEEATAKMLDELKGYINQIRLDQESQDQLSKQVSDLREKNTAIIAKERAGRIEIEGLTKQLDEVKQDLIGTRALLADKSQEIDTLRMTPKEDPILLAKVRDLEERSLLIQGHLDTANKDASAKNDELVTLKGSILGKDEELQQLRLKIKDAETKIQNFDDEEKKYQEKCKLDLEAFRGDVAAKAAAVRGTLTLKHESQLKNSDQKRSEAEKALTAAKAELQRLRDDQATTAAAMGNMQKELAQCREFVRNQDPRLTRLEAEAVGIEEYEGFTTVLQALRAENSNRQSSFQSLQEDVTQHGQLSTGRIEEFESKLFSLDAVQQELDGSNEERVKLQKQIHALAVLPKDQQPTGATKTVKSMTTDERATRKDSTTRSSWGNPTTQTHFGTPNHSEKRSTVRFVDESTVRPTSATKRTMHESAQRGLTEPIPMVLPQAGIHTFSPSGSSLSELDDTFSEKDQLLLKEPPQMQHSVMSVTKSTISVSGATVAQNVDAAIIKNKRPNEEAWRNRNDGELRSILKSSISSEPSNNGMQAPSYQTNQPMSFHSAHAPIVLQKDGKGYKRSHQPTARTGLRKFSVSGSGGSSFEPPMQAPQRSHSIRKRSSESHVESPKSPKIARRSQSNVRGNRTRKVIPDTQPESQESYTHE